MRRQSAAGEDLLKLWVESYQPAKVNNTESERFATRSEFNCSAEQINY